MHAHHITVIKDPKSYKRNWFLLLHKGYYVFIKNNDANMSIVNADCGVGRKYTLQRAWMFQENWHTCKLKLFFAIYAKVTIWSWVISFHVFLQTFVSNIMYPSCKNAFFAESLSINSAHFCHLRNINYIFRYCWHENEGQSLISHHSPKPSQVIANRL